MKLIRLELTNFKGIRSFTLEPNGNDISVYAENGTGKTSLADAFSFLLFGKDSLGRADFEIKMLDEAGEPIHNLDHTVEAELEIDGKRLTLKKTYRETYTKKRGSALSEFTGHTTDYWIHDVPVQAGEYSRHIDGICSEGTFRMLTDPVHFLTRVKWQDRRAKLLEICGDVDDQDVIAGSEELAGLPAILGQHSLENYRKILDGKRKAINDQLRSIPVRIDEARRSLVTPVPGDHAEGAKRFEAEIASLQEKRATASAGGETAEQTKRLAEIDGELITIANRYRSTGNPKREGALAEERRLGREIQDLDSQVSSLSRKIEAGRFDVERQDRVLVDLRTRHKAEQDRGFAGSDSCPACGQALPEERLQSAVEAFNQEKARKLGEILAEGKPLREKRDRNASEIETWVTNLETLNASLEVLRAQKAALIIPADETPDPTADEQYRTLSFEKDEVQARITQLREGSATVLTELDTQIGATKAKLAQANEHLASAQRSQETKARIEELSADEKRLAQEFEKLEHELHLCEQFVRAKVSMLTDRINSKFELCRFRLFEEQINGGLQEICEVTYRGAPPSHGQGINCGLDAINVLADHMGFAPCIFVDNAEAITELIHTKGQQIRLIVPATASLAKEHQEAAHRYYSTLRLEPFLATTEPQEKLFA